jgi:hypothetical protein
MKKTCLDSMALLVPLPKAMAASDRGWIVCLSSQHPVQPELEYGLLAVSVVFVASAAAASSAVVASSFAVPVFAATSENGKCI